MTCCYIIHMAFYTTLALAVAWCVVCGVVRTVAPSVLALWIRRYRI